MSIDLIGWLHNVAHVMSELETTTRAEKIESIETVDVVPEDLIKVLRTHHVSEITGATPKVFAILDDEGAHVFAHVMDETEAHERDDVLAVLGAGSLVDVDGEVYDTIERSIHLGDDEGSYAWLNAEVNLT